MDQIIGWPCDWIQSQFPFSQSGWYHKIQSPNPLIMWWVFLRWAAPILNHTVTINYQSPPQITKTFLLFVKLQDLESPSQKPWKKASYILYCRDPEKTDHQTVKAFIVPSREIGLLLDKNVMLMWSLFMWPFSFFPQQWWPISLFLNTSEISGTFFPLPKILICYSCIPHSVTFFANPDFFP